uniref:EGF-like domain-containing protein n=1 Tax=Trichogramma kaykai TaxID=54128 RepID=A0ABD2VV24_9HYME
MQSEIIQSLQNQSEAEFNNSLLLLQEKSLWLLNLETEHHFNWHESNNYISEFYFNFKGKPMWFEDQSKTTHSLTLEYDGLPLPANLKVKAIVDDSATGNSYVIDEKGKHLLVLNEYYQQSAVILSDLENAIDIKIDPLTRLIFILANGAILRCNMDGQSLKTLKSLRKDISDFTLDYNSKKVYSLDKTLIQYSDYDGNIQKIFHKFETFDHVSSLTFQNDKLFWMQQDEFLKSQSLQHIIYCKVNKICQKPSKITVLFHESKIVAYPNTSVITIDNNPCHLQPPVCDHICILVANSTYTCACDQFYQLSDDGKTCKFIEHYLIYLLKFSFHGKFINNSSSCSNDLIPFLPVYFNYEVNQYHDRIVFSKGSKDFEIFISDYKNMYSIDLKNAEQKILFKVPSYTEVLLFTYDSEVERLYILMKDGKYLYCMRTYDKHMMKLSEVQHYSYEHMKASLSTSQSVPYSMVMLTHNKLLLLTFRRNGKITQFNSSTNIFGNSSNVKQNDPIILLQKNPPYLNSRKFNWLTFHYNNVIWGWGTMIDDYYTVESSIILTSVSSNVNNGFIYEENLYVADSHSIWCVQKNSSINANIIFKSTEDIREIKFI